MTSDRNSLRDYFINTRAEREQGGRGTNSSVVSMAFTGFVARITGRQRRKQPGSAGASRSGGQQLRERVREIKVGLLGQRGSMMIKPGRFLWNQTTKQ